MNTATDDLLTIRNEFGSVVAAVQPDGSVALASIYYPDRAAEILWDALEVESPSLCPTHAEEEGEKSTPLLEVRVGPKTKPQATAAIDTDSQARFEGAEPDELTRRFYEDMAAQLPERLRCPVCVHPPMREPT